MPLSIPMQVTTITKKVANIKNERHLDAIEQLKPRFLSKKKKKKKAERYMKLLDFEKFVLKV